MPGAKCSCQPFMGAMDGMFYAFALEWLSLSLVKANFFPEKRTCNSVMGLQTFPCIELDCQLLAVSFAVMISYRFRPWLQTFEAWPTFMCFIN